MFAYRVAPVIALAAAGCSLYFHDTLKVDATPRPATVLDSVRVLAQEPSQTYKVVALVSVSTNVGEGTLRRMTRALAVDAAELGANGILVGPESITQTKDQRIMTARAILFDSIAPPPTPLGPAPGHAGRIVGLSVLGALFVVPGIIAIITSDDPPEFPTTPSFP